MLSKHISLNEATKSITAIRNGIDNIPSDAIVMQMKTLAEACFEPLRAWYGKPIKVNSFYRSKELNAKIGGASTSQHVKGQAIDMDAGSESENKKIFDWCKANLKFDQLIAEGVSDEGYDWVHISFVQGHNRNETLYAKYGKGGKMIYSK